ncbi:KH domain-containing protein [Terriglobus saanensis]|uniref:RNA-binding protein KhpA n=1 Tax=Terriglobus saanensis (strain ATCC BAA-1853 / DSM 23119 / SP1PR4) TaxID=401053 RepID=E8V1X2_TERSS|nr:KH domain-containing protein [Terriglobus saanensis]ADV83460.1 hypothetical protein AciPR4_2685 [Terriglobus saanensis SP1PR4]
MDIPKHPQEPHAAEEMRDLVRKIARALVDKSDQVRVEVTARHGAIVLELSVATTDLGKVIGRQGQMAHSIRTILGAACMKCGPRITLDIVKEDPHLGRH